MAAVIVLACSTSTRHLQLCETQDSGTQGSGTQGSGTQGSGTQGSGTQGSGTQDKRFDALVLSAHPSPGLALVHAISAVITL
jgi:hypothetical protein